MGILDNFPHLATAKIRARTQDSIGGSKDTFPVVFQDRACWRQLASDREINEFARRGMSITNKVYFTTDPELDERHILIIDGDVFEVRSASKPDASAGKGVVWRTMCELTTTGSTGVG
jgi:hypothetical protein